MHRCYKYLFLPNMTHKTTFVGVSQYNQDDSVKINNSVFNSLFSHFIKYASSPFNLISSDNLKQRKHAHPHDSWDMGKNRRQTDNWIFSNILFNMIKYSLAISCFYFLTKCDCSFTRYESRRPSEIKCQIFIKKHSFKTKEII